MLLTKQTKLLIMLSLVSTFMVVEIIVGFQKNFLTLLVDGFHMLNDTIGLFISYYSVKTSRRSASMIYPFGWSRIELVAVLLNSSLLINISFSCLFKGLHKLYHREGFDTENVGIISLIGLLINIVGLFLLRDPNDNNMKAAFLHSLADTMGSVACIVCAILMKYNPSATWIDPVCSILIALFLARASIPIFLDSFKFFTQTDSQNCDFESQLRSIPQIHELIEFNSEEWVPGRYIYRIKAVINAHNERYCNTFTRAVHSCLEDTAKDIFIDYEIEAQASSKMASISSF